MKSLMRVIRACAVIAFLAIPQTTLFAASKVVLPNNCELYGFLSAKEIGTLAAILSKLQPNSIEGEIDVSKIAHYLSFDTEALKDLGFRIFNGTKLTAAFNRALENERNAPMLDTDDFQELLGLWAQVRRIKKENKGNLSSFVESFISTVGSPSSDMEFTLLLSLLRERTLQLMIELESKAIEEAVRLSIDFLKRHLRITKEAAAIKLHQAINENIPPAVYFRSLIVPDSDLTEQMIEEISRIELLSSRVKNRNIFGVQFIDPYEESGEIKFFLDQVLSRGNKIYFHSNVEDAHPIDNKTSTLVYAVELHASGEQKPEDVLNLAWQRLRELDDNEDSTEFSIHAHVLAQRSLGIHPVEANLQSIPFLIEHARRMEILAHMVTIVDARLPVAVQPNLTMKPLESSEFNDYIGALKTYFESGGQNIAEFKDRYFGFVSITTPIKYRGLNLFGYEWRVASNDASARVGGKILNSAKVFLHSDTTTLFATSRFKDHLESRLSADFKSSFKWKATGVDINPIASNPDYFAKFMIQQTYYLSDLSLALNVSWFDLVRGYTQSELNERFTPEDLQRMAALRSKGHYEYNLAVGMIFHDWSKDPLVDESMLERIRLEKIKAIDALYLGLENEQYMSIRVVREFLINTGLYQRFREGILRHL